MATDDIPPLPPPGALVPPHVRRKMQQHTSNDLKNSEKVNNSHDTSLQPPRGAYVPPHLRKQQLSAIGDKTASGDKANPKNTPDSKDKTASGDKATPKNPPDSKDKLASPDQPASSEKGECDAQHSVKEKPAPSDETAANIKASFNGQTAVDSQPNSTDHPVSVDKENDDQSLVKQKPTSNRQSTSNKPSSKGQVASMDKATKKEQKAVKDHKDAKENPASNDKLKSNKKAAPGGKSTLNPAGSSPETSVSWTLDSNWPAMAAWDTPAYKGNWKFARNTFGKAIEGMGAPSTKNETPRANQNSRKVLVWGPATVRVNESLPNAKQIAKEWASDHSANIPAWGDDTMFPLPEEIDDETQMKNFDAALEYVHKKGPKKAKSYHWKAGKPPKCNPNVDPFEEAKRNPTAGLRWDNEAESDDGDPYREVKRLAGWDGRFQPPPEDWDNREQPVYSNDKVVNAVWKWMISTDQTLCVVDLTNAIHLPEFIQGLEVVPREWAPGKIEGHRPEVFWQYFGSRAPLPVDPEDLDNRKPFWDMYLPTKTGSFLAPLIVTKAELDPKDFNNRHNRARSTAQELVVKCQRHHKAKIEQANKERNQNATIFTPEEELRMLHIARATIKERLKTALKEPEDAASDARAVNLKANIYLRPVKPADIPGITELYNHYVTKTISVPEFNALTVEQMADRVNAITSQDLPYIVAVAKGSKPKGRQRFVREIIVGFITLDDYCDKGSMWRYVFELELFVHPDWVKKGVGSSLMDRLLHITCNSYMFRGGYNYENHSHYLQNGSARVIKIIKVEVPVDCRIKPKWIRDFFENFGFKRVGHLREAGYKYGEIVDLVSFQYTTDEIIDPNQRPTVPL